MNSIFFSWRKEVWGYFSKHQPLVSTRSETDSQEYFFLLLILPCGNKWLHSVLDWNPIIWALFLCVIILSVLFFHLFLVLVLTIIPQLTFPNQWAYYLPTEPVYNSSFTNTYLGITVWQMSKDEEGKNSQNWPFLLVIELNLQLTLIWLHGMNLWVMSHALEIWMLNSVILIFYFGHCIRKMCTFIG